MKIIIKTFHLVILLNSGFLYAQNFTGKVLDENSQPVAFANIIVLALPDSTFAGGATTAETGVFSVAVNKPASDYLLTVSCLGHESFFRTLNGNSQRDLGNIVLKTETIQMQGVSVVARLPKIRFEKGKYIADIENSMAATGNTVEALLNQLPGVWASSADISVNGKSGVTVYINERPVNLHGEALMKYLQSIRSEDVSKIEIIQSASAEFSAEGAGGVIRIITKRIIDEGYRGSVSANALYQDFSGVAPYFGFQYGKDKFGAQFSFSGEKSKWLSHLEDYSKDFVNGTNYDEIGTDTISDLNYSTSLTLNYDFDRYNKLIVNAYYLYWGKDEHIGKLTDISGNRQDNIRSTQNSHEVEQDMYNYSVSVNYSLLLDTLGKNKISLLADYVNQYKYNTKDYLRYRNKDDGGAPVSEEYLLNDQNKPYQIYSAELRYRHGFGAGSGLTGLKYGYSSVGNDFYNYENVSDAWMPHPEIGYDYQYTEQIVSGFYQYELVKEKWSAAAGLRGEYTDGKVKDMADNPTRFDLFPSVYYGYKPNAHHSLGFSYTRRIQRVSYFTLLPKRYYSSRYTMITGNPDLKPNILNNLGLNYSINEKYYLSVNYSWNTNALSRYNTTELIDGRSILVSTYTDGVKSQSFNMNIYIPINFTSWWSCTNQASVNLDAYKTPENEFDNFNYDVYTQHDFSLPFDIKGQILYRYYSESKSAYSLSYPYNLLNVYLQKSFLKDKKLNVKLEANRLIFNKSGEETTTPQAFMKYYMYGKNPLFRLTLAYSFGKGKAKQIQQAQKSNDQEKGRMY